MLLIHWCIILFFLHAGTPLTRALIYGQALTEWQHPRSILAVHSANPPDTWIIQLQLWNCLCHLHSNKCSDALNAGRLYISIPNLFRRLDFMEVLEEHWLINMLEKQRRRQGCYLHIHHLETPLRYPSLDTLRGKAATNFLLWLSRHLKMRLNNRPQIILHWLSLSFSFSAPRYTTL